MSAPRLKERFNGEVRPALKDQLGLANVMQVPRLEKIVLNSGVGRATVQQSLIEGAQRDMDLITGQKSVVTRAKKSIANFKLREDMPIGVNDQLIFPEIDYDRIDTQRGFDVTIVTTARTDDEGRAFLSAFGFPFRQETS
jgi:large subunit ribosomal protein L5